MDKFEGNVQEWLGKILGEPFTATKHRHAHQDEAYKIETPDATYYLKASASLVTERDNLKKLEGLLEVPKVIDFHKTDGKEYLLISALPGKNLVELIGDWPVPKIVETFARAVKRLHGLDVRKVFPEADSEEVLLHGDMALPNIIISAREEIGYIDFGQLSFGSPELDLADSIWSLQRNLGPDYGTLFLEKYGHVRMTPKIEEALAFRYEPSKHSDK